MAAAVHAQLQSRSAKLTKTHKPYLELELADSSGGFALKLWSDSPIYQVAEALSEGKVLRLEARWTQNAYGLCYSPHDKAWKTPETIYNKLKDINEKGGNLLLNIGPDGNGVVQPEAYEILTKTAELLKAQPITKSIPKITEVPDASKR